MTGYGQFCAAARSLDALGGRWTLLVVRELLCGSRRYSDIRRGVPRISRSILSERLQALIAAGAVERRDGPHGPDYSLTEAGRELAPLIAALATWGQRWLPRHADTEDLDLDPVLVDMQRRVRLAALPRNPLVVRFEMTRQTSRFLLLKPAEASLCAVNPGFPEPLVVHGKLAALAAWWRGDVEFPAAQRSGLALTGPKPLMRAFPGWFERYQFAHITPVSR